VATSRSALEPGATLAQLKSGNIYVGNGGIAGESNIIRIDLLMKLRPVAFYYKPELDETQTRQYGLVAEEVAQVGSSTRSPRWERRGKEIQDRPHAWLSSRRC